MTSVRLPLMSQDPNIPNEESSLPQKEITVKAMKEEDLVEATEKIDVPYFRKCLVDKRKILNNLCDEWSTHLSELGDIDNVEAITGDIRSVIGQARLVMAERFTQFEGLVDNCEFGGSDKPVTCVDLQGFWDMIYFQVADVVDKFATLQKRKENQWKVISKVVTKPKKFLKKSKSRSSAEIAAAAARKEAAKKRLAAAKAALQKDSQPAISFDAGFFKVDSPARKVAEKEKTPRSRSRKKTTTPKAANFMHGRFLTPRLLGQGSSTKKILRFATPVEKKENTVSPLRKLTPKKLDHCTEDMSARDQISLDESVNNKENIAPLTEIHRRDRKSLHGATVVDTKSVAILTDPDDFSKFESAIQTISEQMKVVLNMQGFSGNKSSELVKKLETLEAENKQLKIENTRLKDVSVPSSADSASMDSKVDDGLYEAHYKRLLEENQLLKVGVAASAELGEVLQKSEKDWKETFALFLKKSEELENYQHRLNERNKRLNEKEQEQNQEVIRLTEENSNQAEEIEKLNSQLFDFERITQEFVQSKATVAQLEEENKNLKENCEYLHKEKKDMLQKLTESVETIDNIQNNLKVITEEKQFEQEEFAINKADYEEENCLLQSQLATTEATLQSTVEVLQKVKDKAMENHTEADELRNTLEKTREDMIVLREETDITKVNSKLAILEQQQEVINCEAKLRQLLESMADFLLNLKKTNPDEVNCDDLPVLSDHPLKTPSKSLVVSALLRHDSQGLSSELSPEEKFDTKAEACLFALINDVTSLMANIIKTAAEVASRYELETKQLIADKTALQSKVDSLKQEISSLNQKDKEVELSLRRNLLKVIEERNQLRQNLASKR